MYKIFNKIQSHKIPTKLDVNFTETSGQFLWNFMRPKTWGNDFLKKKNKIDFVL